MSILKATLLDDLNTHLVRAESNIDTLIENALILLTTNFPALKKSATMSVVTGDGVYSSLVSAELPSDVRNIVSIRLNDGTEYKTPLTRMISWERYLEQVAEETSADRDEPTEYLLHNRTLYLYPTPDAAYTAYIDYHGIDNSAGSIGLEDNFRPGLQYFLEFLYMESKGQGTTPQAQLKMKLGLDGISALAGIRTNQSGRSTCKYHGV